MPISDLEESLREAGYLDAVDVAMSRSMGLSESLDRLGTILTNLAMKKSHTCVKVGHSEFRELRSDPALVDCFEKAGFGWEDVVASLEGHRFDKSLIYDNGLLSFRKTFLEEEVVARFFRDGQEKPRLETWANAKSMFRLLFENVAPDKLVTKQAVATLLAGVLSRLILTGGPGTGKTFTTTNMLWMMIATGTTGLSSSQRWRVALAAPTGKAATRLRDAIEVRWGELFEKLPKPASVDMTATTLHRLLGVNQYGRVRVGPENPLPYDIVVVDELSMASLDLVAALLHGLASHTRLIFVGDPQQLPSIQPGNVMADLCGNEVLNRCHSSELVQHIEELLLLSDVTATLQSGADLITHLEETRRFQADSGIGVLARIFQMQVESRVKAILSRTDMHQYEDLSWFSEQDAKVEFLGRGVEQAARIRESMLRGDIAAAFESLSSFRILCLQKQGPTGVHFMNREIRRRLALVEGEDTSGHFIGLPILILENDPGLGLYNGDVGIIGEGGNGGGRLYVFFETEEGLQRLPLELLPQYDDVYAMTVHKSQGSEFQEVAILYGVDELETMSRELFYTATTRAREKLLISGKVGELFSIWRRRVRRCSRLAGMLWGT
ncbi:MAG: exodeoxyribonuclease V subunit alpha [Myxococcota bacterium]|nr:exodeoxyribonuclease V subunit alpha [Myxococcota bacterium]